MPLVAASLDLHLSWDAFERGTCSWWAPYFGLPMAWLSPSICLSVHPSPGSGGGEEEVGAMLGGRPRGEGEEVGTKTRRRGQLQPFSRLKRRRGPFRPRPPSGAGGQSHRPQCPPSAQGLEKRRILIFSFCFRSPGAAQLQLCCFLLPLRRVCARLTNRRLFWDEGDLFKIKGKQKFFLEDETF